MHFGSSSDAPSAKTRLTCICFTLVRLHVTMNGPRPGAAPPPFTYLLRASPFPSHVLSRVSPFGHTTFGAQSLGPCDRASALCPLPPSLFRLFPGRLCVALVPLAPDAAVEERAEEQRIHRKPRGACTSTRRTSVTICIHTEEGLQVGPSMLFKVRQQ